MILWVILFLLIVAISFLLAYLSMKDYQEVPGKSKLEYGLFLIRHANQLTPGIIDSLQEAMREKDAVISLERLLKGKETALTIFGPKIILQQVSKQLNLLELEDYALNLSSDDTFIWEMGVKDRKIDLPVSDSIFKEFPSLENEDQFFWQVVFGLHGSSFRTQIRAAIHSKKPNRKEVLIPLLRNLDTGGLIKIPQPFSQDQMITFFKMRSLSKDSKGPIRSSYEVIYLLKVV